MRTPGLHRLLLLTSVALVAAAATVASAQAGGASAAKRSGPATRAASCPAAALAANRIPFGADRGSAAAACTNLITDGGFETGGIPSSTWDPETSTNFGTPLCDVPSCGTGGGASPPRTGSFWAWFGGIPAPETATLGQTLAFPAGGTATLGFWMRIGTVSSPFTDVLNVRVDGTIVQSYPEPTVAEGAYTFRTVNLNAYANGASHQILFEYIGPSSGTGSYVVDDVTLNNCATTAVAVASSSAARTRQGVTVRWATGTSDALLGFRVYRQVGAKKVLVSGNLIQARAGVAGSRYSFVDRTAPRSGALQYWIQAIHLDGSKTWHGPASLSS